ncbi:MAG: amidase [Candidatus Latescibacterota bacterium]|nr:amidase [Candidatus Latescibacterota bacterium]
MARLEFPTLIELSALLRRGELSPVELTEHYLDRIGQYNPTLNAYIEVTAERARATAHAAEASLAAGDIRSPLHGVPLALKDLIDVQGLTTSGGSRIFQNAPGAVRDATVARRLFDAGTVLLGKTHMVEFAYGGAGINHHHGTPWNPWDASTPRLPGGSSSGSGVAVAADLAPAALGSDTGGSVRIPAAFGGFVGLKPTYGRVSNAGVMPLDPRLDSVGPMCRSVADAMLLYNIISGPDADDAKTLKQPIQGPVDDLHAEIAGCRVCIPREYFWDEVDPEVEASVRATAQVFADLGVYVDEISMDELNRLAELREEKSLTAAEAYAHFERELTERIDDFDPIVSRRMLDGREISAADYLRLLRLWQELCRDTWRAMEDVDALLTPTTPIPPAPVAEIDDSGSEYFRVNGLCLRNTSAANLLGLCAISLPCGFTDNGLPIGLQLIGRPFEEHRLLRLAQAFESATEWHQWHPDLGDFE